MAGSQPQKDSQLAATIKTRPAAAAPGVDIPSEPPLGPGIDFILDVPLEISVELGRTQMVINDLLKLGQGSVVELAKMAGEPLEIRANRKLIARGEVVEVNEKYGVRLTEIISHTERVEKLK